MSRIQNKSNEEAIIDQNIFRRYYEILFELFLMLAIVYESGN